MIRKLLFLLAALISLAPCRAQSYRLFTSDSELPSSMTNHIFQDHNGFVWIATENGLVKYDGARFVTYTHNPDDEHSLAHDFVTSLTEDHDGYLYVSTYEGVQVYDPKYNTFSENVCWPDGSHFDENSNHLCCSSSNAVYSAGYSICRLSYDGEHVTAHKLGFSDQLNSYTKIQEDLDGQLWISIHRQNIILKVREGEIVQRYDFEQPNTYLNDIAVTPDGTVYASVSNLGLLEYNRNTDRFEVVLSEFEKKNINRIYAYDDYIVILSEQSPIVLYDRKRRCMTLQNLEAGQTLMNEVNPINYLIDRDGNRWIAIAQQGVLMIPAGNSPFNYIGSRHTGSNLIGEKPVSALYQDSEGLLWVGTSGDGLYGLDMQRNSCLYHFVEPASITHFHEDVRGDLLISSASQGTYLLDRARLAKEGNKLRLLPHNFSTQEGDITSIHAIERDNRDRLWIGTMGKGLFCYDGKTGVTRSINEQQKEIHKWIDKLFISNDGYLWLCTFDGLERINIGSNQLECQRFLKRTIVYDIQQDRRQTLWLATSAGLFNLSTHGDTLQHLTTREGLPSQSLAALQIDADDCIWVSSNMGLSKVDPATSSIINFYSGDGLQGNEFSKKASTCDRQGRLWFGGMGGITHFMPEQVRPDNRAWNIRIVAMTLGGKEVTTASRSDDEPVMEEPIYEAGQVSLAHDDQAITLYFAPRELNCPPTLQFEYQLNNQPWQRLPIGVHSVSFSNLKSGNNLFSVRAVQSQRESNTCTLCIFIRPIWYETWWARTAAGLLIVLILALVLVAIRAHYREYNERMLAERQKEFHDAQTRMFIDITHEIRTPLTLILGPIRKLLATDDDASRQSSYSTIQRNANRILRLMEQMIDLRRMDKGVLKLHFEEKDLVESIANVFSDFKEQAALRQLDFSFEHEGLEKLPVWIDPDYFDKIVINLVSNALKYTQMGGKVKIALQSGNEQAYISISDNGPGIPLNDRERIFDRYYRGPAEGTKTVGSGIGLSLTRSLVEMHHGTIRLESRTEEPTGSTFIVALPLGRNHLEENEIIVLPQAPSPTLPLETTEQTATAEEPQRAHSKYHILLVDDEEEIRRYLQQELSADFHVASCSQGKEALSMLLNVHFDLVISDVMMPGMDGETLCRKIRNNININHLPVILLTANTQEESMIAGLDNGADEYLTKPVSINLLRSRIYNLIRSRERLRTSFTGKQIETDKMEKIELKTPDEQLMDRVMREVNRNLSNQDFTVETLAANVGLSRVHLNRKLKELTNQNPRDLIRNIRLKQAALLIEQGNHPLSKIAELTGFTSASNFSRAFQELYGVAPKDYKQENE